MEISEPLIQVVNRNQKPIQMWLLLPLITQKTWLRTSISKLFAISQMEFWKRRVTNPFSFSILKTRTAGNPVQVDIDSRDIFLEKTRKERKEAIEKVIYGLGPFSRFNPLNCSRILSPELGSRRRRETFFFNATFLKYSILSPRFMPFSLERPFGVQFCSLLSWGNTLNLRIYLLPEEQCIIENEQIIFLEMLKIVA